VSGYGLEIDQLRRAATAARYCGEQLGKLDAAATISAVPVALPGSRSAPPITTLANAWRGELAGLSEGFLGHAARLTKSADLYAANESAAAEVFAPVLVDDGRGVS
jgi:hypothetical protein